MQGHEAKARKKGRLGKGKARHGVPLCLEIPENSLKLFHNGP